MANLRELQKLIETSYTLQSNPSTKANLEANLSNLEEDELDELEEVLRDEQTQITEINQRYETEMQELNEKMILKSQELYMQTKRIVRQEEEANQSQNDNQTAEQILSAI